MVHNTKKATKTRSSFKEGFEETNDFFKWFLPIVLAKSFIVFLGAMFFGIPLVLIVFTVFEYSFWFSFLLIVWIYYTILILNWIEALYNNTYPEK